MLNLEGKILQLFFKTIIWYPLYPVSYTHLVGSAGADAFAGKVSNESPIGQALIGKKKGDVVTIETPAGSYDVKILKVEKTA